jgi:hypothetical protein
MSGMNSRRAAACPSINPLRSRPKRKRRIIRTMGRRTWFSNRQCS